MHDDIDDERHELDQRDTGQELPGPTWSVHGEEAHSDDERHVHHRCHRPPVFAGDDVGERVDDGEQGDSHGSQEKRTRCGLRVTKGGDAEGDRRQEPQGRDPCRDPPGPIRERVARGEKTAGQTDAQPERQARGFLCLGQHRVLLSLTSRVGDPIGLRARPGRRYPLSQPSPSATC